MAQKTFAELLLQQHSIRSVHRGEILNARILSVSPNNLILALGSKSEGIVSGNNFAEVRDFAKTLRVGDTVAVLVTGQEGAEGLTQVSLKPAASGFVWEQLVAARDKKEPVKARVIEKSRGGLEVSVLGIASFIPNSQLGRQVQNAGDIAGRSISVIVLSLDRDKNQLVLSERAVSEKDQIERQIEVLSKLKQGEILDGKVVNIVAFGAFVEVVKDGMTLTGLVHKSEISWDNSKELESGQSVRAVVLNVKDANLSLSIKRTLSGDPWEKTKDLKKDMLVSGVVVRTTERNIIVEIMPGVEGTITRSKLPAGINPQVGDKVNCIIENVDIEKHRLALSLQLTVKPIGYK